MRPSRAVSPFGQFIRMKGVRNEKASCAVLSAFVCRLCHRVVDPLRAGQHSSGRQLYNRDLLCQPRRRRFLPDEVYSMAGNLVQALVKFPDRLLRHPCKG